MNILKIRSSLVTTAMVIISFTFLLSLAISVQAQGRDDGSSRADEDVEVDRGSVGTTGTSGAESDMSEEEAAPLDRAPTQEREGADQETYDEGNEGLDMAEKATRLRSRMNEFADPDEVVDEDNDGDGVPTARAGEAKQIKENASDWKCGLEEGDETDDGKVHCWGQGVRAVATGEENDDGSLDTATRVLNYLQVRAEEVRSWSEEEKEAFRELRRASEEDDRPENAAAAITEKVMENEKIRDVEASEEGVKMKYRAKMKLFGLFSMDRDVEATISEDGEPELDDLPWYSFLSGKPDSDEIKQTLQDMNDIWRDAHDTEEEEEED
ncbi:MAG: hypothetical protein ACLFNR_03305 [Candidatus Paceibacterota bacterium]